MTLPSSSSWSSISGVPWPAQILSSISKSRLLPMRQGVHLPQDSSTVNSRKKRAIFTMQVSSSMMIMPPEPIIEPRALSDS